MKFQKMKPSLFIMPIMLLLVACTSVPTIKYPVHALDSSYVLFRNITVDHLNDGIKVSGNVRKKAQIRRRLKIQGHIHVMLKSKDGTVLETTQANVHRKSGNSGYWHFDGTLKTLPSEGSRIVVEHHDSHSNSDVMSSVVQVI